MAPATASIVPPKTGIDPGRPAVSAAWPRLAPSARITATSAVDLLIIWVRPWPASTSIASPAMAPKTLSAIASGVMDCRT